MGTNTGFKAERNVVAEKAESIGEPGREETVCWNEDRGGGLSLLHVERKGPGWGIFVGSIWGSLSIRTWEARKGGAAIAEKSGPHVQG